MKQLLILLFVPFFAFAQNRDCLLNSHKSTVNGNLEFEILRTYDAEGKIISKLETRAISGGTYTSEEKYAYNAKGYLSKVSTFQNNELRFEKDLTYNNLGQLISETESRPGQTTPINRVSVLANQNEKLYYELDGSVSGREVEQKNAQGLVTFKELRGNENQLYHSTEKEFSENGAPLYSKNVDVLGQLTEERFWEYNEQGKLLKDSTLINENVQRRTLYVYSETGGLTKRIGKNASNVTEYEIVYKLNEGNLPEEEITYYNDKVNGTKKYFYTDGAKTKEEQYNANGELLRVVEWQYKCD